MTTTVLDCPTYVKRNPACSAPLEILLPSTEIAALLAVPVEIILRLVKLRAAPPWLWSQAMSRPRWPLTSLPEWMKILDRVEAEPDSETAPELPNPTEIFKAELPQHRRERIG